MAKMLKSLFLSLFLAFGLFAASLQTQLDNFDAFFLKANEQEKILLHQELKSLYIKTVMDGDKAGKIEVLKRLIISSSLLKISDKIYVEQLESEGFSAKKVQAIKDALKLLEADIKKHKQKNDANASINTKKDLAKPDKAKQDDAKNTDTKPTDKATKNKTTKNTAKPEKQKEDLVVKSVIKQDLGLSLALNRDLEKEELKKFVLKSKGNYRSVIDFKGILGVKSANYKFKNLEISLSQYNPKTIRLVMRTKKEEHFRLILSNNTFKISLEKPRFLLDIRRLENGVNLSFDYPPNPQIQEFIREGIHYAVATFKARLKIKPARISFKGLNLSVSPFGKEEIKVILKSSHDFELRRVDGDKKIFLGYKIKVKAPPKPTFITKITKLKNGAKIQFSGDKPEITSSLHKKKGKKYQILSFKARLKTKKASFDYKNAQLNIVQFDPKIARIVLEGKGDLNYYFEDNALFLSLLPPMVAKKRAKSITIDAGHGGKDSGAISGGKMEKDIVLSVALKLGKILKKRGFRVYYTRTKDVFINLRDRTKRANDKNSDLFISIHANAIANKKRASKVHGIETFFLSPARSERSKDAAAKENQSDLDEMNYFSQETFLNFLNREKILASNKLAIDVQRQVLAQLRKHFSVNDGGVREAPFWVLVGAGMPSILIELGYITHPTERKLLFNKAYQNALATGIANGIESYFDKNP